MTEYLIISKAKEYLLRLKKNKPIKNRNELIELNKIIEELDSVSYKLKKWKELENETRKE